MVKRRHQPSKKTATKTPALCRTTRIMPQPIRSGCSVANLVENAFQAYNGARLREACRVFIGKMLDPKCTVGMSLAGAMTPAGVGISTIIPMIEQGFVDWIVATGANLYHDSHFALDLALHQGSHQVDDGRLRQRGIVRIYDIFFSYKVLLDTDAFYRQVIAGPEFQRTMSSAEFHHRIGSYLAKREDALGLDRPVSILTACWRYGVPVYTSSPGDSSIGMNVAAMELVGNKLKINPNLDVNETAAIVLDAKMEPGGTSGVLLVGGGSPKNFVLQTEPQIQEVLGIDERGHDYFIQLTDARPDTGGLSGATPSEAVSWGKIDPSKLPDTVVCYVDATIGLPILAAYALSMRDGRRKRGLYYRRGEMMQRLTTLTRRAGRVKKLPPKK